MQYARPDEFGKWQPTSLPSIYTRGADGYERQLRTYINLNDNKVFKELAWRSKAFEETYAVPKAPGVPGPPPVLPCLASKSKAKTKLSKRKQRLRRQLLREHDHYRQPLDTEGPLKDTQLSPFASALLNELKMFRPRGLVCFEAA